MPTFKISQLTTATAVSATNQFEINQNGASRSLEVSVLGAYLGSTFPVGGGRLLNVQVFTSSGTYTRSTNVTRALVYAKGAGGGGGGGGNSGNTGGTGGTTTFGSHVTATGGSGGQGSTLLRGATGGAGGTGASNAPIQIPGQGGGASIAPTSTMAIAGQGGGQGGGRGIQIALVFTTADGVAGAMGGGGSGKIDAFNNQAYVGGGGGEGQLCIAYVSAGLSATEVVTIGAGGTGGSTRGGAGGPGYVIVYEYA